MPGREDGEEGRTGGREDSEASQLVMFMFTIWANTKFL